MVEVEPAEDETFVLRVERGAPLGGVEHQGVALEETGASSMPTSADWRSGRGPGPRPARRRRAGRPSRAPRGPGRRAPARPRSRSRRRRSRGRRCGAAGWRQGSAGRGSPVWSTGAMLRWRCSLTSQRSAGAAGAAREPSSLLSSHARPCLHPANRRAPRRALGPTRRHAARRRSRDSSPSTPTRVATSRDSR